MPCFKNVCRVEEVCPRYRAQRHTTSSLQGDQQTSPLHINKPDTVGLNEERGVCPVPIQGSTAVQYEGVLRTGWKLVCLGVCVCVCSSSWLLFARSFIYLLFVFLI